LTSAPKDDAREGLTILRCAFKRIVASRIIRKSKFLRIIIQNYHIMSFVSKVDFETGKVSVSCGL
jgi:hypothetical protein